MRADISSRTTFIYKFIFPAVWIPLMGAMTFAVARAPNRINGAERSGVLVMELLWVVVCVLLLRFAIPLKRVQLRDGRIYASNYRREIEIAPGEIERITQNVWINIRPITLHLRHETAFGRRIRFIPPSRLILTFWNEDPLVPQLRRFAGLVPESA
jgi:hypothetical protein